ncbi:hypothetical protein [Bradyrhizobium sp. LMTR 3]|nr:hypothetical protein [Bradyrhizobium sp. LMTR 3]
MIELLIACSWLNPALVDDRHEIGAAYYRAVIEAARDISRRRSAR